jgi:RNA polymerase sigma factor (sigma-70 family)
MTVFCPPTDVDLLCAWRERHDREAMDELIRRHIGFVYGAARRMLHGDASWAQDVTQAVFMLLIQKSPRIGNDAALAVWLHRAARYASANARRVRLRQYHRDRRAARPESDPAEAIAQADEREEHARLLPVLDEAIEQLGPRDRAGVILCYFHRHTYRQIGVTMGISEEAARKRIARSIERLREYFVSRGIGDAAAFSSGAISSCLVHQGAIVAPTALGSATMNLATLSQLIATAGASSSAQIMKGVVHTMLVSKLKLAAAACIGVAVTAGATTTVIHQALAASSTATITASATDAAAADANASEDYVASLPGDRTIEFLAVTDVPTTKESWRALDGAKIAPVPSPYDREEMPMGDATKAILCRKTGPETSFSAKMHGGEVNEFVLDGRANEAYWLFPFKPEDGRKSVDMEIDIADGEWQTLCEGKNRPGHGMGLFDTPQGGVAFTHLMEHPSGGSMVYVAHEPSELAWRYCVVDANGQLRPCVNIETNQAGKLMTAMLQFDVPVDQVVSVVAQTRAFNRKLTIKNIALDGAHPTKPQIEVGEIKGK